MFKTLFYDNRQLLVLSFIIIVVSGVSAFIGLPRMEDPRIKNRNPLVITMLPGASAERVEALVTKKIETQLRNLAEIKTIESQSRSNVSFIQLELADEVVDTDEVFTRIRDKLAEVESELPATASKPELDDERGAVAFTLIIGLTWEGDSDAEQLNLLNRGAEELADRIRNVSGTDLVRIYGAPQEEITIRVDRDQLAELGISPSELSRQIQLADSKVASGTVRSSSDNYVMEVGGAFESTHRIADIPILGGKNGDVVHLNDIAKVSKDWLDPPSSIALSDSRRSIFVAARMLDDRRVDVWMNKAEDVVKRFESSLSPSIQLNRVFEQNRYTSKRLGDLGANLVMGALVVVLVIFVMMGWRSAILIGMALPLVSAMVLFSMQWLGIPLHQMSIFGLIVAIGLLIDNAIVVVDDITEKIRAGTDRRQAVASTVSHLFIPLLGSTLTTVFAFMPIFLLPGSVGEFVGTIATTVILALIFSFFVSLTIVAATAGIFANIHRDGNWMQVGLRANWFSEFANRSLRFLMQHPLLAVLVATCVPLVGFMRVGQLPNQFFPGADRNQFYVQLWMPPQTSIYESSKRAQVVERHIKRNSGVSRVDWLVGGSMPTVYYNLVMDQDNKPNYAQAVVTTETAREAAELIPQLQKELDLAFPDSQAIVRQLGQGPPVEAPVEIRVYGPSVSQLKTVGRELQNLLYRTPGILHTRTTFDVSRPKILIQTDESEARLAGMSLNEIAGQLQSGLEGAVGGLVLESTEQLPVRLRFGNEIRKDLNEIASTRLKSNEPNQWLPLNAISDVKMIPETAAIPRRDGERCNTIQGFVEFGVLPPDVTQAFLDQLQRQNYQLPEGYRMQVGGDAEKLANSMGNLFRYAPLLAVLMFGTIVLSFRSFLLAGVLASVAAFSAGIGFFTLWLVGFPLGFNPLIGTAGLIGLAINDSIIVLAQIRTNPAARRGDRNAIVNEVLSTGRHVISTTLTTIGGFIPLLLAGGTFWPPLAIVIAGGVGGATLLATVFVPAVYILVRPFVELKETIREVRGSHLPEMAGEPSWDWRAGRVFQR